MVSVLKELLGSFCHSAVLPNTQCRGYVLVGVGKPGERQGSSAWRREPSLTMGVSSHK